METTNVTAVPLQELSPVTLAFYWPKMGRLIALLVFYSVGSISNGFYIASFFIDPFLRKVGNVFLACTGFADALITTVVIPISAIALLSEELDTQQLCHVLHFFTVTSTYSYNIFHMFSAVETFYRVCQSEKEYSMFIRINRIPIIAGFVLMMSFMLAGIGVYLGLDYNYCNRSYHGSFEFRVVTGVIFHLVPFIVTVFCLLRVNTDVRRKARKKILYKRTQYKWDISSVTLNIITYSMFVISWLPYLFIVFGFPNATDTYYYYSAWLGLIRPVLNNLSYALFNRTFRKAFGRLFKYIFCKSNLTNSYNSRHRRALRHRYRNGDVRVHVMHRAIMSTPRYSSSSREIQELWSYRRGRKMPRGTRV